MKKEVIKSFPVLSLFSLLLINLVSAADFSLSNALDSFDPESVFLITIFILVFTFCFWGASRVFSTRDQFGNRHPNKMIAGVVSLALAFFAAYGANKYGFDLGGIGIEFELFQGIWGILIPLILLAGIIYLLIKMKLETLLIGGIFLALLSLTGLVFEKDQLLWWGIILIIMYLVMKFIWWLMNRKKIRRENGHTGGVAPPPSNRSQNNWQRQLDRQRREAERQRAEAEKQRREAENQNQRAIDEEKKRHQAESNEKLSLRQKWESINRVRTEQIRRLQKEYQRLDNYNKNEIQKKINTYGPMMGGGAFVKRKPTDSDADFKERYNKIKDAHKRLSQAHEERKQIVNQMNDINNRITHLDKRYREKLEWIRKKFYSN